MLDIGWYLIIVNGQNIKISVSEISIFELPGVENCIRKLSPTPCLSPKNPNRVKNT